MKIVALFLLLTFSGCSMTKVAPTQATPPRLEMIKNLAGSWESSAVNPETGQKSTVVYRLSSGGTAVEETLFPKSDHEMVSMYYQDGDSIAMTHYCMLNNRPQLRATSLDGNKMRFVFERGDNMKFADLHIHDLTITFLDPNHIIQEWEAYKDGKPEHSTTLEFTRKS